ncbi:hypothetical protein BH23ACI1_BH23ACI1_18090 [soil metagenome]
MRIMHSPLVRRLAGILALSMLGVSCGSRPDTTTTQDSSVRSEIELKVPAAD